MDAINWRILPNLGSKDRFWIQDCFQKFFVIKNFNFKMIFDCSDLKTEKAFHKNCFEFDSGANVASSEILKNVGEWMKSLNTGKIEQRH